MPADARARWATALIVAIALLFPIGAFFDDPAWAPINSVLVFVILIYNTAKIWALGHSGRLVLLPLIAGLFSSVISFAFAYQHLGLVGPDGQEARSFWNCLYFSMVTWTTVGYGDFQPSEAARLFAGLQAFAGYCYMALGIGIGIALLSEDRASA